MSRNIDNRSNASPHGSSPAPASEYLNFSSVMPLLWRRKLALAVCVAAGLVLSMLLMLTQPKVYQSRASIEIQIPNEDYLDRRALNPITEFNITMLEPYLQTQLRLIQSDTMLLKVGHELNLGNYAEYNPPPSWLTQLKEGPGARPSPSDLELLEKIRARLTLRLTEQTEIVDILYESTDPRLAAAFANKLAEEYQAASLQSTAGSTGQTANFLSSEIVQVKAALDQAEVRLRGFLESNKLLPPPNQESVAESRLKQLQAAAGAAQEARVTAESKYQTVSTASSDTLARELDSETLRAYRLKLADLRQSYAENSQILTPTHYKLREIQAEISAVQDAIDRERGDILARLLSDYKTAELREKALNENYDVQAARVAEQTGQSIRYDTLRHEVEVSRQIYDATLQKLKQSSLAAAQKASNVRIIDRAIPSEDPIKPRKLLFLALGMASGLLGGMLLLFGKGPPAAKAVSADKPLTEPSPADIPAPGSAREDLGSAEPRASASESGTGAEAPPRRKTAAPRVIHQSKKEELSFTISDSVETTTSWLQNASGQSVSGHSASGTIVCVSSLFDHSGGAQLACELSQGLAESGRKVLLADANDLSPSVHKAFQVPNTFGLFDVLRLPNRDTQVHGKNAIWKTQLAGLCVMPAGKRAGGIPELARQTRVAALCEYLRKDFEVILIHTPLVFERSEMSHVLEPTLAQCLALSADGMLLATEDGLASVPKIRAAADRLQKSGVKVIYVQSCPARWEDPKAVA